VLVPVGDNVGPVIETESEMVKVSEVVALSESLRVSVWVGDLVGRVCDGEAEDEMVQVRDLPQLAVKEGDRDLQGVEVGVTDADQVAVGTSVCEGVWLSVRVGVADVMVALRCVHVLVGDAVVVILRVLWVTVDVGECERPEGVRVWEPTQLWLYVPVAEGDEEHVVVTEQLNDTDRLTVGANVWELLSERLLKDGDFVVGVGDVLREE